jgi:hypothetical protein
MRGLCVFHCPGQRGRIAYIFRGNAADAASKQLSAW